MLCFLLHELSIVPVAMLKCQLKGNFAHKCCVISPSVKLGVVFDGGFYRDSVYRVTAVLIWTVL